MFPEQPEFFCGTPYMSKKFSLFWEHVTFHNLCLLQGMYVKTKLGCKTGEKTQLLRQLLSTMKNYSLYEKILLSFEILPSCIGIHYIEIMN